MKPILGQLLNLLPKRPAQVVSMQSAKGVMNTWDEVRGKPAETFSVMHIVEHVYKAYAVLLSLRVLLCFRSGPSVRMLI